MTSIDTSTNCSISFPPGHGFVLVDLFVYVNEKGETVVTSKKSDKSRKTQPKLIQHKPSMLHHHNNNKSASDAVANKSFARVFVRNTCLVLLVAASTIGITSVAVGTLLANKLFE